MSEIVFGSNKKSRKVIWNFTMSFHCKRAIGTEHNLPKQQTKHTKFGLFCCLLSLFKRYFSSSSDFTSIKLCIHAFYSTKFYLQFHIPTLGRNKSNLLQFLIWRKEQTPQHSWTPSVVKNSSLKQKVPLSYIQ